MNYKIKTQTQTTGQRDASGIGGSKLLILNTVCFALVLLIGGAYIAQVNRASTRGYQMREIEDQISALRIQNQQVEYHVAQLQSVDSVTNRLKMLGLVAVDETTYVSAGTSSVAVNR